MVQKMSVEEHELEVKSLRVNNHFGMGLHSI